MIGVICSGGGSAVAAAHRFASDMGRRFHVITDRACGIEAFCRDKKVKLDRIEERDNHTFSERAVEALRGSGAVVVLLYYDRLISRALTASWTCINFHPSLLPAYPGFRAIERLVADRGGYLGHTCHIADESMDGGPILAQSVYPLQTADYSVTRALDISFVQKLALTLLVVALVTRRMEPQAFLGWWRSITPTGPGDFINPNALSSEAKSIVSQQAAQRRMSIML